MLLSKKKRKKKTAYKVYIRLVVNKKWVNLSPTGVTVDPSFNWLELISVIRFLIRAKYFFFWCLGDILNHAIDIFGVQAGFLKSIYATPEVRKWGIGRTKLSEVIRVCREVPRQMRTEGLSPQLQYYMFTMDNIEVAYKLCQKGWKEGWDLSKYIEERDLHYPPPPKMYDL